jgi:hypothetical protein
MSTGRVDAASAAARLQPRDAQAAPAMVSDDRNLPAPNEDSVVERRRGRWSSAIEAGPPLPSSLRRRCCCGSIAVFLSFFLSLFLLLPSLNWKEVEGEEEEEKEEGGGRPREGGGQSAVRGHRSCSHGAGVPEVRTTTLWYHRLDRSGQEEGLH